jgi:glutathione S-transferase
MPQYKLTYFNGRGRGELIRLVFAQAGVEYEDVRVEKDKWPALKSSTPFGQLPILEFDGKTFSQSVAISRFLARKFNLAGKTELDQLQADMVIDCLEDGVKPLMAFFGEKDEARKAELKKKYADEQLPTAYAGLESILKWNKGGDGFFVGDSLTWADLALLMFISWGKLSGNETLLDKYPKLKALEKRVESQPKIAAWIAKRPVTEF